MRRTLWYVIGAGLTFACTVALYLRTTSSTNTAALALIGLSPLLIVPLVALVATAWVTRSALLRVSTLGLWVVYLVTIPSLGSVVGCGAEEAEDGIVVYSQNVRIDEGDPARVAGEIARTGADVVVLQEVWPGFIDGLRGQASLDRLRYRASEPDAGGVFGVAVWSRWPLQRALLDDVVGKPLLSVDVDSPHGTFTVYDVHTTAPTSGERTDAWEAQLLHLGTVDVDRPVLLAGDFNATADHAQFRGLLAKGWTDVHDPKGCGFDATWPHGRFPPVALLRLDHILVSDRVEVLGVELGDDGGSDHAPLITTVRLTDPRPT